MVLLQRDVVPTLVIRNINESGLTLAGDEYIVLFVHGDAIFGEDGYCAIIGSLANTHERCGEVIKGVCLCCTC